MAISVTTGNIIEEDHYYPFGLKIAGISSKKLGDAGEGTLKNNYLYNDKELFDDGGLNWYDYGFRNYDPQVGRFTQLDPLTDDYPYYTPFQFAGNDPIANVDQDGLEPENSLTTIAAATNGANTSVLQTLHAAGQTAELANAGTQSAHWVSTLPNAVVSAKLPAKLAAGSIKSVISTSISVTMQSLNIVDNVAIGKPSPVQDVSLEQRKRMSLVIHDQMDPVHPLILGTFHDGGKDQLFKNKDDSYSWGWRRTGIDVDEGFWLMFMPLPKGLGLLKGAGRAAKVAAEPGVTVIGEGMVRVEAAASEIPGAKILNDMPKFTGTAEQITSQMMQYNRKWILEQLRSGRTILDIGRDLLRKNPSIFYQMEQNMLKNYLKLHPGSVKIIKP